MKTKTILNTIGNKVKLAREAKKMEVKELALILKITPGYLYHIERDDPVIISERLTQSIEREFKHIRIADLVDQHNVLTKQWRALYLRTRLATA